jgi:hypothetical protein
VALKAGVHFGGVRDSDSDRQVELGRARLSNSSALLPGFRLALHGMFAPHDHFALGAQLGLVSWQSVLANNLEARRSWYIDLTLAPEGRLLVERDFTLYVVPSFGVVYAAWAEVSTVPNDTVDTRADPGWGIAYGASIGARLALDEAYGLLAEAGATFHSFQATVHADALALSVDAEVTTWQFAVLTGMYF